MESRGHLCVWLVQVASTVSLLFKSASKDGIPSRQTTQMTSLASVNVVLEVCSHNAVLIYIIRTA